MIQPEHSKIINRIAKQVFSPFGIIRKGQSRTWIDDNGWYTTQIEFQPSGFSKGTYLNIGANFHWHLKDYWSFDYGSYRIGSFVEFENEEQFVPEIERMAKIALDEVLLYRKQLISLDAAKQAITKYSFVSDELWGNYHKGVICGLTGDKKTSENYFNSLLSVEHNYDWANKLKERVLTLKTLLNENEKFRESILTIIKETRKLKKLKEIEIII